MVDTRGFAVVIAASEDALRGIVRGAWHADGAPTDLADAGRIPASIELQPGIVCAGYAIAGGHVEIPQEELDVCLWPAGNGVEIKLGLRARLAIRYPPVPSAGWFDLRADVRAQIRVDTGGADNRQVVLRLEDVARSDVQATLTSGDPLLPRLNILLTEFVTKSLDAIDRDFGPLEISWTVGLATITVTAEGVISNPQHPISARRIGNVTAISVPITVRISEIQPALAAQALDLPYPMSIATHIVIAAPLESPAGRYTARLSAATISVGALRPGPGSEGANYRHNRWRLPLLDDLIQTQIREYSERVTHSMGDVSVAIPTIADIETLIGDLAYQELVARRQIAIWTAEANVAGFSVTTMAIRTLPNMLVIGLNAAEGADLGAAAHIIPTGRQFGVAISGECLQQIIAQTRARYRFAATDLPRRLSVDGREVQLTTLDMVVMNPAIRMRGSGTVLDTVLSTFIVGGHVRADVGLHWAPAYTDSAHTGQTICPRIRSQPAVALKVSVMYWVIAAVAVMIAFGALQLLGSLIVVGGVLILWLIGWRLSQRMVARTITEVLRDMVVWPPNLTRIGQARAVFIDPIVVDPSGMVLAGDVDPSAPE